MEYQTNPLYDRFPFPTTGRPAGRSHQEGTCGGHADLCPTCERIEQEWHNRVALELGKAHAPLAGESLSAYWRRIGGRYLDTWCGAAFTAYTVQGDPKPKFD